MFRRNNFLVWIGVMTLSGMFLMGQEPYPPCDDTDGDGYGEVLNSNCPEVGIDCDDSDADVYPGAPELCDGVDNQCPGDLGYGEVDEPHEGMACIPAGCFDMGDHFNEGYASERPVHNVCISAFEMDVHEVTNREYKACVEAGQCTPPFFSSSYSRDFYHGNPEYDDFPVIWITWFWASEYCAWVDKRLPTEAEWEYAARGGLAGKRYPWGDTIIGTNANYWNSGDPWDNETSSVQYYAPNGYGLYDMAGNVWEWVNDWYSPTYYQECYDGVYPYCTCPGGLPPCTCVDPPGPADTGIKVLRGGSFDNDPPNLRLARHHAINPDSVYFFLGLRCARDGADGP